MQVFATSCAMLLTAAASSVLMQQQIHLQLVLGMTTTSVAVALFYADPGTLTGLNKASSMHMQRQICAVGDTGRELGFHIQPLLSCRFPCSQNQQAPSKATRLTGSNSSFHALRATSIPSVTASLQCKGSSMVWANAEVLPWVAGMC